MMRNKLIIIFSILLTSNSFSQVQEIDLVSRMDGSKTLIDGTVIEFWGYGEDDPNLNNDKIFIPGPVLRFNVGDTVIINLTNDSPEDHTIHWHGLDVDQANDGVPSTTDAVGSFGGEFTYTFVCKEPGTYLYHCHVLTTLHLAMGMYGSFIIDPEAEDQIYENSGKFTKEYNYLFSEMNTSWNLNPLSPGQFYLYEADYAMVNGWAGSEIEDKNQSIEGTINDSIGMRLANVGYGRVETIFPNDLEVSVYGSDGREVAEYTADTIQLYPGERFGVVGYPQTAIDDSIEVNYYDLRNENLLYTNYIPVSIIDDTGLETFSSNKLSIYPNPFREEIVIDKVKKRGSASITDLNGKIVWDGTLEVGENTIRLNLDQGVYLLKYQSQQYKLIKH